MATAAQFDARTELLIEDLLASGRFAERNDVLRHGVELAHAEDRAVTEPLTAAEIASIERGLADVAAGRVRPAEEVFDEVLRELRAKR